MRSTTSSWGLGVPGGQYWTSEENFIQLESGQRKKYQALGNRQQTIVALKFCGGDLCYCPKMALTPITGC